MHERTRKQRATCYREQGIDFALQVCKILFTDTGFHLEELAPLDHCIMVMRYRLRKSSKPIPSFSCESHLSGYGFCMWI